MEDLKFIKYQLRNILSFEVDLSTAKEFESLIYELESEGVYMDFIFNIDSKFTNENNVLIHIEKLPNPLTWNDISIKKYHYFESKIMTVNLEYNPSIYFIFSALYLDQFTNLIYDFYEGSDTIYVSFFVNTTQKENSIEIKSNYITDLSEDTLALEEIDISQFTGV